MLRQSQSVKELCMLSITVKHSLCMFLDPATKTGKDVVIVMPDVVILIEPGVKLSLFTGTRLDSTYPLRSYA